MKRTYRPTRAFVPIQIFIAMGMLWVAAACGNDPPPPVSSNGTPLKPCASDGECARPTPYCAAGYCVECLSSNNCLGGQCSTTLLECVQCLSNADCGAVTPYCNAAGNCVQCVGAGNCPMGQTCNATTNRCQFACTSDAMCTPLARYCSPTLGVCVGCVTDANCGGGAPYCNTQIGACVECMTDANCANGSGGGNTCRGFRCR